MFILECGHNHFGNLNEAKLITNFFLKSSFKSITFMCHTKSWYENHKKNGIDFKLPVDFYKKFIEKCKIKKKNVGLGVCDIDTFKELKNLDFKFYKLLSIAINNFELIKEIDKRKKKIYISTGYSPSILKIKKCINSFSKKTSLELLHTPRTDKYEDLNFKQIERLRKNFNLKVGYSNHFHDPKTLFALSSYNPSVVMLYLKQKRKKKRKYPDHNHAFYLDEIENLKKDYLNCLKTHRSNKTKKINVIYNKVKF